jgi:hypothetical protein
MVKKDIYKNLSSDENRTSLHRTILARKVLPSKQVVFKLDLSANKILNLPLLMLQF